MFKRDWKTHDAMRGLRLALFRVCFLLLVLGPKGGRVLADEKVAGSETELTFHARSVQPGEIIRFHLAGATSLERVEAGMFQKTFPFYGASASDDGEWHGLVGIDLDVDAGVYTLTVRGSENGEEVLKLTREITVHPKKFPTRRLTVSKKYVNPAADVLERIRQESNKVRRIFASVSSERLWDGSFLAPVPGRPNSSFGKRSILNGQPRSPHTGTDFTAAAGTRIYAPNHGRVVMVQDLYYSGKTVIIDHGLGLFSYLAHLSAFDVEEGAAVQPGTLIGRVGATGRVTGAHLHWTVRLVGTRVDPLSLMAVSKE